MGIIPEYWMDVYIEAGVLSLGVPGVPCHPQILADQLTLSQPGWTDYAHLITTGTHGFSDFPTALIVQYWAICIVYPYLWFNTYAGSAFSCTFRNKNFYF